jgi:hypothetical protein
MQNRKLIMNTGRRFALVLLLLAIEFIAVGLISFIQADTLTVCASGCDYTSIQTAIDNAAPYDTISIGTGVYTEYLNITKAGLTIQGSGPASVTINTVNAPAYGIYVSSTHISLKNFWLNGPPSGTAGYGLKIEGTDHLTVENVTVVGSGKSGIDLNGVNNVLLANIVVSNNKANGLALTDVNDARIENISTSNNSWGGIALYTYGRYYPGGSDNITLAGTNSFSENNSLYIQTDNYNDGSFPYPVTNFFQVDFSHIVKNGTGAPNYSFYRQSAGEAIDTAVGLISPQGSYIRVVADNSLLVGPGMSIQTASDTADDNTTVNVTGGIFTETVSIANNGINLRGAGADSTTIQGEADCNIGSGNSGGLKLSQGISGTTIAALKITGFDDGIQLFSGPITNTTIENVSTVFNCRHGIYVTMSSGFSGLTVRGVTASNNNSVGPQRFGRGIWIINGVKEKIIIEDSVFHNNRLVGIDVSDGSVTDLLIKGNEVINNGDSGIAVLGPQGPAGTLVYSNTVANNGRFGIEIKNPDGTGAGAGPGSVVVSKNSVSRNTDPTDARDHAGILVVRRAPSAFNADQPAGVVVTQNIVSGYQVTGTETATGEGFGIVVEGDNHLVADNTVTNNDIGIQLQAANPNVNGQETPYFDRGDALTTTNVVIDGNFVYRNLFGIRSIGPVTGSLVSNTVYTNTWVGILTLDEDSTGIVAAGNQICLNGIFGFENRGSSSVDATNNWWGAVDGPGPVGSGSGDGVSVNVTFIPFQTFNPGGVCGGLVPAPDEFFQYLPFIVKVK